MRKISILCLFFFFISATAFGGPIGGGGGGGGSSSGGSQTLQDTVVLGRSVTDAVDLGSAVCLGGLTNKTCFYDGRIAFSPTGPLNWSADSGYSVGITDHLGADIARFDDATQVATFTNPIVGTITGAIAASQVVGGTLSDTILPLPTLSTLGGVKSILASGTQKLTSLGTDGMFISGEDVQTIGVNGDPPMCPTNTADFVDNAGHRRFFCDTQGGNAIDFSTLGDAPTEVCVDGGLCGTFTGASQLDILAPDADLVTTRTQSAANHVVVNLGFESQATSNQVFATKTTSGTQVPAFRALVEADLPATTVFTDSATEIDAHTAASPSAAALSSVNQTTITNDGQAAADINVTLPTAAAHLGFLATVGTAQAANYWRFTAASAGIMYLDGSATGKDYVQFSAPVVGNYLSCFTFKTGGAYKWICASGIGVTSTN